MKLRKTHIALLAFTAFLSLSSFYNYSATQRDLVKHQTELVEPNAKEKSNDNNCYDFHYLVLSAYQFSSLYQI